MKLTAARGTALAALVVLAVLLAVRYQVAPATPWLPELSEGHLQRLEGEAFLEPLEEVQHEARRPEAAPFVLAEQPPVVDFVFHTDLPAPSTPEAYWSAFGEVLVASDGSVYSTIGDHGDPASGATNVFVYRWHPRQRRLELVIRPNEVMGAGAGQPSWTKIHARLAEGLDETIYFTATINDGNDADQIEWTERIPAGQLLRYDPRSGRTQIVGHLPDGRVALAARLDRERGIWYSNAQTAGKDALAAIDIETGELVFVGPDDMFSHNRNIALGPDGRLYYNGPEHRLWYYDPESRELRPTSSMFEDRTIMRCSSRPTREGVIYGTTMRPFGLFRYDTQRDELETLGSNWLTGEYSPACELSPDERFLYYVSSDTGAVVQYEVATGTRKVIAFLRPALEDMVGFLPDRAFGVGISDDGSELYLNFNGNLVGAAAERLEEDWSTRMTAFVVIHIPESER